MVLTSRLRTAPFTRAMIARDPKRHFHVPDVPRVHPSFVWTDFP
jgi:hypothetical protein